MITQTKHPNQSEIARQTNVRIVSFEAPRLDELTRQITAWLMEHPSVAPLSVSHAAETRFVVRTPPSLAGPAPRVFYTAILVVDSR